MTNFKIPAPTTEIAKELGYTGPDHWRRAAKMQAECGYGTVGAYAPSALRAYIKNATR